VVTARAACMPYGLPLIVEPLVLSEENESYGVDGRLERILPLVRQAVELGADVIKADPTENLTDYRNVVEAACGVPVLVRGGSRVEDALLLERTSQIMRAGASGIVYGRNIFQHPDPDEIVSHLSSIVHGDGMLA